MVSEVIVIERVFVLLHSVEYSVKSITCEHVKTIGVYSSKTNAEDAMIRYSLRPFFCDYPIECFHVDEYKVNNSYWYEGFV